MSIERNGGWSMRRGIMEKRIRQAMAVAGALALMVTGSWDMPGRLTAVAAAATDTEESVGGELMKGKFSSLTLYRWEKLKGDMPRFEVPTNVMIMGDAIYMAVKTPDGVYAVDVDEDGEKLGKGIGSFVPEIDGHDGYNDLKKTNMSDRLRAAFEEVCRYADEIPMEDKEDNCYLLLTDRSRSYRKTDPMIRTDRAVFYTDDNRDTPYLKYTNVYGGGEYDFFFSRDAKDPNTKKYYVSIGYDHKKRFDQGKTDVWYPQYTCVKNTDNPYSNIIFRTTFKTEDTAVFSIERQQKSGLANINYGYLTLSDDFLFASQYKLAYTAYVAKELNFSRLNNNTTIGDGQVLTISKTGYLDSNGKEVSTSGCIIGNGQTLTINKGGVLSISGDLINNGTIVNNGGTILIKNGGCISSFLAGKDVGKNGCGTLKCSKGDILIEKGGALYAGMNDTACNKVPFYLDNSSTLINCGLLVYGEMRLGEGARVELRSGSKTVGNCFGAKSGEEEKYITTAFLREELKLYEAEPDKYRIEKVTTNFLNDFSMESYEVYMKPTMSVWDSDYDILSNYSDKILKASSGIPTDCKGLYRHENLGGMYKSSSSAKTTVLKFSGADLSDGTADDLVTTKDGL